MFNLFKLLFRKRLLIDQIIDLTGLETLMIWNGIDETDSSKYLIPMYGRKHYSWEDPRFRWLMIGFGHYDNYKTPIIELWINRNMEIVRCQRNHPDDPHYEVPSLYFERRIDKLYNLLQDVRQFTSENTKMMENIHLLLGMEPKDLYRSCVRVNACMKGQFLTIEELMNRGTEVKASAPEPVKKEVKSVEPPKEAIDVEAMLGIEYRKEKLRHH